MNRSLAVILLLKNENKYVYGKDDPKPQHTMLVQQLEFLKDFVHSIYIMDDNSDDGSDDIYQKYIDKMGAIMSTNGEFNENKHFNTLCEKVKADDHGWMLYLDGDEILEDNAVNYIKNLINGKDDILNCEKITVRFKYANLWRSRYKYRKDKWYGSETGKLFRVHRDLKSYGTEFNNHHFAYSHPEDFGAVLIPDLHIIHYAWIDWEHMKRKVHRFAHLENKFNGTHIDVAHAQYLQALDEKDIVLGDAHRVWLKEYRERR